MAVTNLTGYTWNADYYTFSSLSIKYINFTSNDSSYSSIKSEEGMETTLVYYGTELVCDPMSGYLDRDYETIVITGGTDVTNTTLISWLEANGTLTPPELVGYEVTFVTNGGTSVTKLEDVEELPTPLPTTTKANHVFAGWYYDNLFTQKANAGDELTTNVTLYAKWYTPTSWCEDIADAIREKDGTTEPIKHLDFPERILAIYSGIGVSDELSLVEGTLTIDSITSSTMTFISGTLTID